MHSNSTVSVTRTERDAHFPLQTSQSTSQPNYMFGTRFHLYKFI